MAAADRGQIGRGLCPDLMGFTVRAGNQHAWSKFIHRQVVHSRKYFLLDDLRHIMFDRHRDSVLVPELPDTLLQGEQNPLDGLVKRNDGHGAVQFAFESDFIERVEQGEQTLYQPRMGLLRLCEDRRHVMHAGDQRRTPLVCEGPDRGPLLHLRLQKAQERHFFVTIFTIAIGASGGHDKPVSPLPDANDIL